MKDKIIEASTTPTTYTKKHFGLKVYLGASVTIFLVLGWGGALWQSSRELYFLYDKYKYDFPYFAEQVGSFLAISLAISATAPAVIYFAVKVAVKIAAKAKAKAKCLWCSAPYERENEQYCSEKCKAEHRREREQVESQ